MRAALGIMAMVWGLGACVPATSGGVAMSHSCITTITGPDGKPQQAVVEADDAGAAALLCEGDMASGADIARAMLGDGPVSKADKVVVRAKPGVRQVAVPPAATPSPVQTQPTPQAGSNPLVHPRANGPGCGLRMVGGTGYVCAHN
ncbi:MAG: hypothetical protein E6Q73_02620 [Pseudorhodobacter sp.]|nr:MAG: hypothetical protein E6Q73_02620 [Pseudorhodobacter sp.]